VRSATNPISNNQAPTSTFLFFSSAAAVLCAGTSTTLRRAAEKQKGGFYSRFVSINRPPLTGFGGNLERIAWSSAKAASEVQRGRGHSPVTHPTHSAVGACLNRGLFNLTLILLTLTVLVQNAAGGENVSLAGKWRFALDRADTGVQERWFERRLASAIHLPGSLPLPSNFRSLQGSLRVTGPGSPNRAGAPMRLSSRETHCRGGIAGVCWPKASPQVQTSPSGVKAAASR
jgi:hypothetical protein